MATKGDGKRDMVGLGAGEGCSVFMAIF